MNRELMERAESALGIAMDALSRGQDVSYRWWIAEAQTLAAAAHDDTGQSS